MWRRWMWRFQFQERTAEGPDGWMMVSWGLLRARGTHSFNWLPLVHLRGRSIRRDLKADEVLPDLEDLVLANTPIASGFVRTILVPKHEPDARGNASSGRTRSTRMTYRCTVENFCDAKLVKLSTRNTTTI